MTVTDWDSAIGALRAAVVAVEGLLPQDDVTNAWELIDAGEPGVAFEVLCTQLDEYEVKVDEATRSALADVGRYFDFDPYLWESLEVGVPDDG